MLSQLLSGANRVEYTGFADQGFYCWIDSENMDSMIKTYNRVSQLLKSKMRKFVGKWLVWILSRFWGK